MTSFRVAAQRACPRVPLKILVALVAIHLGNVNILGKLDQDFTSLSSFKPSFETYRRYFEKRKTYQAIIGFDGENLVGDGGEIHLPAQPFI